MANNINKLKRSTNSEAHLTVYQLNCNSISNKLSELKLLTYTEKPDIFCLCETFAKRYEPSFIGYTGIWKERDGEKGGLAILIRQDVYFKEITFDPFTNRSLEIQIIEISSELGKV